MQSTRQVANSSFGRGTPQTYDVVVIGGGAAGLSGALMLGRSRRSVLVVDAGEPRNAPASGVHGFLTRDGMNPAALLRAGRKEVRGSANAGALAGAAINADLIAEETREAVAAQRGLVSPTAAEGRS